MKPVKNGDFVDVASGRGFVQITGPDGIVIVTHGVVCVRWEQAMPSLRHGWRLVGGFSDGRVAVASANVSRESGFLRSL